MVGALVSYNETMDIYTRSHTSTHLLRQTVLFYCIDIMDVNVSGHYYVSVVAYNGALAPSQVACSDGITYDTSPPAFLNVSLLHARTLVSIGCTVQDNKYTPWMLHENLTRVELHDTEECQKVCNNLTNTADVSHFVISSSRLIDSELSLHYCQNLPRYSLISIMF